MGKKYQNLHGIISIVWIALAWLLGALALALDHSRLFGAYILILLSAPFLIAYFFCMKCPQKGDDCLHVIFGKITKLYRKPRGESYHAMDYAMTLMLLLILTFLPQVALLQSPWMLAVFWVLMIVGVMEIRLCVCRICRHKKCPLNPGAGEGR